MQSRAKKLAFCGVAIALAYVTSFIKVFELPFGGAVTLFSMLFIVLVGYWLGWKYGLASAFVFGILQFIQEPYMLNIFQVCCDYFFAFTALGISGFWKGRKHGLVKGYLAAIVARGFWNTLGGYLFWMEYMPENFPKTIAWLYPVVYNYGFILAEGVMTLIVLMVPAVRKGLGSVEKILND